MLDVWANTNTKAAYVHQKSYKIKSMTYVSQNDITVYEPYEKVFFFLTIRYYEPQCTKSQWESKMSVGEQ